LRGHVGADAFASQLIPQRAEAARPVGLAVFDPEAGEYIVVEQLKLGQSRDRRGDRRARGVYELETRAHLCNRARARLQEAQRRQVGLVGAFDLLEPGELLGAQLFADMQPGLRNRRQADADGELASDEDVDALRIFNLCPEGGDLSSWHFIVLKAKS
jgi:hypothetical protein